MRDLASFFWRRWVRDDLLGILMGRRSADPAVTYFGAPHPGRRCANRLMQTPNHWILLISMRMIYLSLFGGWQKLMDRATAIYPNVTTGLLFRHEIRF